MRLLDAQTLQLIDVRDDAIPPYAILSHTWGSEEVGMHELCRMNRRLPHALNRQRRKLEAKKGYVKVKHAAHLALQRGLSYIWVDTCCIDKTSSAELSEAINSMYLWYQQAAECYAYLSDVPAAAVQNWASPVSSFRRSRWFTRGWTLQELIAPKKVHFFARDWKLLGHKDNPAAFKRVIAEVTGIGEEVLDGRVSPHRLSVSARMAWASYRQTTRLEDTAYCLMGLFEVNIPLLYGEGNRAFQRLQQEIIHQTDDQSLFAWNSVDEREEDPDALHGLLAQSPINFKDAGKIQPLPPRSTHTSEPSSITNQGLRVQVYLLRSSTLDHDTMEEDYYGILDCFIQVGDIRSCPTIRLRRLSKDQYARLETKHPLFLPAHTVSEPTLDQEGYRSIYVRQQPEYYHLPQFRISPSHMDSRVTNAMDDLHYELIDVFPASQWNSHSMTLNTSYSRKLRAMGIFRFRRRISSTDEKVDVIVGLARLKTMQWHGWCFQQICRNSNLSTTFLEINNKIDVVISTHGDNADFSPETLRRALGDDYSLMSHATVEPIQLQGRVYNSIVLSPIAELESLEKSEPKVKDVLAKHGLVCNPICEDLSVQSLTEPCFYTSKMLDEPDQRFRLSPVRRILVRDDDGWDQAGHFKKPLYDYVTMLRGKRRAAASQYEPHVLSLPDELALALFDGDVDQVKDMLAKDPSPTLTADEYGFAPLHWAVAGGSAECTRIILDHDSYSSLTSGGLTGLHVSALCHSTACTAFTKVSGERLDKLIVQSFGGYLDTPLHLAAASSPDWTHSMSHFSELLKLYGPEVGRVNKNGETSLHRAAANDNDVVIKAFAHLALTGRYSFQPDATDKVGRTAMWHAAATGSCKAIDSLQTLSASINLPDDLGRSPLHAACRGGHDNVVKQLIVYGAHQQSRTCVFGFTAMDYAAMFGHSECLRQIVDQGQVTLAACSKSLHIAASCGWIKCVDLLYKSGADLSLERDNYVRLDDTKTFAFLVSETGDARIVAAREGHQTILDYFDKVMSQSELRTEEASTSGLETYPTMLEEIAEEEVEKQQTQARECSNHDSPRNCVMRS